MANFPLTNIFLTLGIVFLVIAVLGQSKLGFIEINPGCLGRVLALFLGVASLAFVLLGGTFPVETIDVIRNYLAKAKAIQQNLAPLNNLLNS
ncbi:hypothetical protein IQ244_00505 [Nostoc sp. LEGE 06077]|uniref:hypothetical protein n=1 Tax=Nostoc sp. LEGE 06077 TaxID=915325 RepID=UPI001881212C|nr:hypothetical protein [Nostoc sp. LEGE 06077]MBE9205039.1 hypothetical protein [Nostoc sp. LEGE 06077]